MVIWWNLDCSFNHKLHCAHCIMRRQKVGGQLTRLLLAFFHIIFFQLLDPCKFSVERGSPNYVFPLLLGPIQRALKSFHLMKTDWEKQISVLLCVRSLLACFKFLFI